MEIKTRVTLTLACAAVVLSTLWATPGRAQVMLPEIGSDVPADVRQMYERGLKYLAQAQKPNGTWSTGAYDDGPAITGLCIMAFMATGEDANHGPYAINIRRGVRSIIESQNPTTGYISAQGFKSMYHHGFAMLALAECHGVVDETKLWDESDAPAEARRSIASALELAVRLSITSQNQNPWNAWRYSPDAADADTSVSGAIMMGMLAARNAGVEVPDENLDKAIAYFVSFTQADGQVSYGTDLGFDENWARPAIASLVYAVARRKDIPQYQFTVDYLKGHIEEDPAQHRDYTRYYTAQALYQADSESWQRWNELLIKRLKESQNPDGSFPSAEGGTACGTAFSLLSLALNYRLLPIYER